jgi:hypothetical protein
MEVPAVNVPTEVAGNVGGDPKPLPPNEPVLADGVDVVEAPPNPPNPPNTEAVGADVVAPNPLPNGDVTVALAPNALPNEPVLGAEVVAGAAEVPNAPPNGLELEGVALLNIPVLGADVVVVILAEVPNPLPNALGNGDVAVPNKPALGFEVVVVAVVLIPPPNGVGVDVVVVAAAPPPKNDPVFVVVVVAVLPNAAPDEVGDVKLSGPPIVGLEPNALKPPVDIIGFVVGEVDCTDVVIVEASGERLPKGD